MIKFENKVLMLGYGAVAKCTLPILLKHVKIPYQNMTILDFEDKGGALKKWTDKGIKFVHKRITQQNLEKVLSKYQIGRAHV
jgi:homospermidine synthase